MSNRVPGEMFLAADSSQIQLQAAEGEGETKLRKFTGTAYTGVKVKLSGWSFPVVVDLSGVRTSKKPRPILRDHDFSKVVGHAGMEITPRLIRVVDGVVSAANEHAREIVESSDNGFPWQMSIGASPEKVVFIEEGESASVNGRRVSGPAYIVRQSVLNEVSFVALGADDATSAAVAASAAKSFVGVISMTFDAWLKDKGFEDGTPLPPKAEATLKAQFDAEQKPAPQAPAPAATIQATSGKESLERAAAEVEAKQARDSSIAAIASQFINERPGQVAEIKAMADLAMQSNQNPEKFELELLRACRPQTGPLGFVRRTDNRLNGKVLEAAICLSGHLEDAEKRFDDQTLQAAHDQFPNGIGLKQVLLIAARENGYHSNAMDVTLDVQRAAFGLRNSQGIQASGFSTLNTAGILSNTANKFLAEGWMAVDSTWRNITAIRSVRDFKEVTSYSLTGGFDYEKVGPGGELKHGTVGEQTYTNKAETYGKMFAITRTDIINDDLGALTSVPRRLGRGAALKLNNVFWTEFLNNSAFFHTTYNNVSTGGGSALGTANGAGLAAAELKFLNQTDPDGNPLGIMPAILLVPPTLKQTGTSYMNSGYYVGGSSTVPGQNNWVGRFRVECSPYMENSNYTGYSAAAWYLLANPSDMAVIEVCFLNGREVPVVETADADFNVLGVQMRGYHDFGVNLQEPRAGVRSAGS